MIKLLSLFSGVGAFESALHRGGHDFALVNYCEIDKYASKAYSMVHDVSEDLNLVDVCSVDCSKLGDIDLLTYGFPCQDISCAGKQRGFEDSEGNRTRSGLFFEALRIIKEVQPKYAIAENVKALTGKKFTAEFETVLTSLDEAGYNNYWQVLNAKDFGVPQNRERVFIVSIRKDIDKGTFSFPEKQPLMLRVKDLLEPVVEEKYYLKSQRAGDLIRQILANTNINDTVVVDSTTNDPHVKDVSNCIIGRYDAGIQKQRSVGTAVIEPKIKRLGHLGVGGQKGWVFDTQGISGCSSATDYKDPIKILVKEEDYKIRKLTPKECFRLMGFTDEEFERIHGISNTQLYKMAGNSIVVNVLTHIFDNLLSNKEFELK